MASRGLLEETLNDSVPISSLPVPSENTSRTAVVSKDTQCSSYNCCGEDLEGESQELVAECREPAVSQEGEGGGSVEARNRN